MRFACSLLSRTLKKIQTSAKIKVTLRTLESRNLVPFVRILPVEIAKVFDAAKHMSRQNRAIKFARSASAKLVGKPRAGVKIT